MNTENSEPPKKLALPQPVKIGLVGCGNIALVHAETLRALVPGATLSVCDVRESAARDFAQRIAARGGVYTRLQDMLATERPAAVHIMTPVAAHYQSALLALEADCHVYLEKPLTESAEQYMDLLSRARTRGCVLMPGYSALSMPVIMQARHLKAEGTLGRLISVHCDFMCAWPRNTIPDHHPGHWAYRSKGGILQNMVDHPASVVIDALDRVDHWQYQVAWRNLLLYDQPDLLHLSLQNDDQIGSFTLSLGHGNGHRIANYYFERGTVTVDMTRQLFSVIRGSGPPGAVKKLLTGLSTAHALAWGTFSNVWKVATGRLRSSPGIFNLVENFYATIDGRESSMIRDGVTTQMTSILDDLWSSINAMRVPPVPGDGIPVVHNQVGRPRQIDLVAPPAGGRVAPVRAVGQLN